MHVICWREIYSIESDLSSKVILQFPIWSWSERCSEWLFSNDLSCSFSITITDGYQIHTSGQCFKRDGFPCFYIWFFQNASPIKVSDQNIHFVSCSHRLIIDHQQISRRIGIDAQGSDVRPTFHQRHAATASGPWPTSSRPMHRPPPCFRFHRNLANKFPRAIRLLHQVYAGRL